MTMPIQDTSGNLISGSPKLKTPISPQINFQLGQKIEAKILNLNLTSLTIKLQLKQALIDTKLLSQNLLQNKSADVINAFSQGQNLNLIVSKLEPQIEFLIKNTPLLATGIDRPRNSPHQSFTIQDTKTTSDKLSLQLISKPIDTPLTKSHVTENKLSNLQSGQLIKGKAVGISGKQIQILLFADGKTSQNANLNTFKSGSIISIPLQDINLHNRFSNNHAYFRPEIKIDDRLLLEVNKTHEKSQFLLLEKSPSISHKKDIITEIIKKSLPNQESPQILINQLIQIIPKLNQSITIPETLKNLAQQILLNLPSKSTLSQAGSLKQFISKSGLFLETALRDDSSDSDFNFNQDFKANILKLLSLTKQVAPLLQQQNFQNEESDLTHLKLLLNKSENTLAKLVLNQLSSLPNEEYPKQNWFLELPYINDKKNYALALEIETDDSNHNDKDSSDWSVTISTTLPRMGKFSCKIFCFDSIVNTYFSTDSEDALKQINEHLDFLKSQFQTAGLKAGKLHTVVNLPDNKALLRPLNEALVDEKI